LEDARRTSAADGSRITGVFVNALRNAGHPVGSGVSGWLGAEDPPALPPAVLTGRIWSFEFRTDAVTLLQVDVSLALYDGRTLERLWRMDFPCEEGLPLWIGLGCKPEEAFDAALKEVEEVAALQFRSDPFYRALHQAAGSPAAPVAKAAVLHEPQAGHESQVGDPARRCLAGLRTESGEPGLPDADHELVPGSSWTGTDEGRITATAHQSAPSVRPHNDPTTTPIQPSLPIPSEAASKPSGPAREPAKSPRARAPQAESEKKDASHSRGVMHTV